MRAIRFLTALGLMYSAFAPTLAQERVAGQSVRYALISINSAYQKMPLLPRHDELVQGLEQALTKANFTVTLVRDLTHETEAQEVQANFLARIQPGDVCLFYFLGYAIQSNNANFLLPIDFDPNSDSNLNYRARSLTGIQQTLEQKQAGLKIIVLETAIQGPELPVSATKPGLAAPDTSESREIVYAFAAPLNALPLEVPEKDRFLFTKNLAEALRKPGVLVDDVFSTARRAVASQSAAKDIPHYFSNAIEAFRFTPEPMPPPVKNALSVPPEDLFLKRTHVNRKDRQE